MSYFYNHLTLMGRLTRDPECREISKQSKKTYFTLAVDRPYKKEDGSRETDFFPVALWGKLGDVGQQLLSKGKPILVWGPVHISTIGEKDSRKQVVELSADGFQLLDRNGRPSEENALANEAAVPAAA